MSFLQAPKDSGAGDTDSAPRLPSILPWVAALAALGFLLWLFTGRQDATPLTQAPVMPAEVTSVADASKQLTALGDRLRMALGSITDEASAKAALPRLMAMSEDLATLNTAAARLPAEQRTGLGEGIRRLSAELAPRIERLLALPGVAAVLRPVLEGVQARLREIGGG